MSHLHANCGVSCHNPTPNAEGRPSGLYLRLEVAELDSVLATDAATSGINRLPSPNADYGDPARPDGDFFDFRPLDAERSLGLARTAYRGSVTAMPPIGTHRVDQEGGRGAARLDLVDDRRTWLPPARALSHPWGVRTIWALGLAALTGTDTEPARAAAGCRDPARSQPVAAPSQTPDQDRQAERDRLVDQALVGEIRDPRVLAAMRRVLRHRFVPAGQQSRAYDDTPLPIGHGQTISQPFVVAFMTEAARPGPRDRCLEIGTGSGYQAAVLAEVCGAVYSIEYLDLVARTGEQSLRDAGYGPERVRLRVGDGYDGWPEAAPFNVILVTAAPKEVPAPLLDQLAVGGRLVIPVGASVLGQELERWTRLRPGRGPVAFRVEKLLDVRFVPFLGKGARR